MESKLVCVVLTLLSFNAVAIAKAESYFDFGLKTKYFNTKPEYEALGPIFLSNAYVGYGIVPKNSKAGFYFNYLIPNGNNLTFKTNGYSLGVMYKLPNKLNETMLKIGFSNTTYTVVDKNVRPYPINQVGNKVSVGNNAKNLDKDATDTSFKNNYSLDFGFKYFVGGKNQHGVELGMGYTFISGKDSKSGASFEDLEKDVPIGTLLNLTIGYTYKF